jgi:hypothetical protein
MYIEHRQYTFHPGKQPLWVGAFDKFGFPSSPAHAGRAVARHFRRRCRADQPLRLYARLG